MTPQRFAVLALTLALGCAGGADSFTGPEVFAIRAVSPASVSGAMGDVVTVAVQVIQLTQPVPSWGARVTFAASDGGLVPNGPITTRPDGSVEVTWRFGPAAKVQTLTVTGDSTRALVIKANVTGNPWTVTSAGTLRYASRLADEGSIAPFKGEPWAATIFGSPPRLIISCQAGDVGIAITHPKMVADSSWVAYSFNGFEPYTRDDWSQLAPQSDSLFHPGPTAAAGALAKQIAAGTVFRLLYVQQFESNIAGAIQPSFGTAGLAQVMPQLMANCPSGR